MKIRKINQITLIVFSPLRRALLGLMVFLLLATAAWGQTIYVNRRYCSDQPSDGTPTRPFLSLTDAYNVAQNGMTIRVEAGNYPETLTLSKRLTIVANGGRVTIGSSSLEVLTQRNGNERTGAYRNPGLNQAMLRSGRWGLLGRIPVEGSVYAQPLYVERLCMPDGQLHNVLFIATETNWVYAFDADPPFRRLWDRHLGEISLAPFTYGIGSTPVIDWATRRMYVSYRRGNADTERQRLAAIDIRTGRVDEVIEISVPGNNVDWHKWHRNRASLLLLNGVVYVAFGSCCESEQALYHGYIIAFNAQPLNQVGVYSTTNKVPGHAYRATPDSPPDPRRVDGGGIWQGSSGLAADAEGNIYVMTGNRRLPGEFPAVDRLDEDLDNRASSFLRLQPVITRDARGIISRVELRDADRFTPYRRVWMDAEDFDLGSAGPVLIPGTKYLMGGDKEGIVYVLDRTDMGGFDPRRWTFARWLDTRDGIRRGGPSPPDEPNIDRVVQKFRVGVNQHLRPGESVRMDRWQPWPHIHGTPAFATFTNGRAMMYVWPEKDYLKAFPWLGNRFDIVPAVAVGLDGARVLAPDRDRTGRSALFSGMPGGMLSAAIDPNQPEGGVLFASIPRDPNRCRGLLRAFDPVTLRELWNDRFDNDGGYAFSKFVPPTIAGSKVFLATVASSCEDCTCPEPGPYRGGAKVLVYGERR